MQTVRMDKFLLLRDAHGLTQCIASDTALWEKIKDVGLESVLRVEGLVRRRPETERNQRMDTGDIEVEMTEVLQVEPAAKDIPFLPAGRDFVRANELLRMKHRYLDLRNPQLQRNLRLRSRVTTAMRRYLTEHGFVDVETPSLARRTPGGAQEFLAPSRSLPGHFYSLVQSPQQFKQLLMVGGLDRYFQVARCYRDETGRPDRQPEFTQIDIELSFTNKDSVMDLVEQLLVNSWPEELPKFSVPFQRLTYEEVMERFGVDKPDLRHANEISDATSVVDGDDFLRKFLDSGCRVKCIRFSQPKSDLKSKEYAEVEKIAKHAMGERHKGQTCIVSKFEMDTERRLKSTLLKKCSESTCDKLIEHLGLEVGDVGYVVIAPNDLGRQVLGRLRSQLAQRLLDLDPMTFNFLWVVDFPLFLPSDDDPTRLESAHHPFTKPRDEDLGLLDTDPAKMRSDHYDLVLNGQEVAGGSIRINDPCLQEKVIGDILKEDSSQLQHLIDALKYGCPPHGGIAIGFDRIMAILTQSASIRDVIAFPKTADGKDVMMGAPAKISDQDKKLYHIEVTKPKK